jgi:viologen exporter family transport system permease protein
VSALATSAARMSRVLLLAPLFQLTYRAQAIVAVLDVISRIFLFTVLWNAVYGPGQTSGGMDVRQAITYSALASLLVSGRAYPVDTFSDRIREGTIVYLFLRPLAPLPYFWGVHIGGMGYRAALLAIGGGVGLAAGVVAPPASPAVLAAFVVSVVLAELIYGCFFLFLELIAFWTTNIWGVRALYFFALQLLSGALVPIWFFPDWAIALLAWSPFAAATSTPVSVYIGRIPADSIAGALALQVAWLAVLVGLAGLLWHRARDRVIVQGG